MELLAIDFAIFLEKFILIFVVIMASLLIAMYTTYAERKVAAIIQDRYGPNRAGPFGLLQPVADGVKLFFKEEIIPLSSNKLLFILGPSLAMLTAMLTSSVIPWGGDIELFGRRISLEIADVNIGILFVFGVVSLGVYGIMIGGWASNNKFSLLAAVRGASQIISYELAMGLSLIALLMMTGSMSLGEIVRQQMGGAWGGLLGWNVFYQPLGFLIFLVCAFAECNRTPFDLPEAEAELVSGYNVEYSAMTFALFFLGEYANMLLMSSFAAILFLGGWLPLVNIFPLNYLSGSFWFSIKIVFGVVFFILTRSTLHRYRYDQLMHIGWKCFLPLSLSYLIFTVSILISFNWLPN